MTNDIWRKKKSIEARLINPNPSIFDENRVYSDENIDKYIFFFQIIFQRGKNTGNITRVGI